MTASPVVKADHHDDENVTVTCATRNVRGFRFQARGAARFPRDYYVWRQVQRDAADQCVFSGSLICIDLGCVESYAR